MRVSRPVEVIAPGAAMSSDDEVAGESDFVSEYQWLRSFGKTDAAIAQSFGLSEAALVKRLQRAGLRDEEQLSPDREIDERLRALIEDFPPFDSWSFPFTCDPVQVSAAISVAVRRGLAVRIGARRGGSSRAGSFRGIPGGSRGLTRSVA